MNRALNFSAGPASLPEEVLAKAQKQMMNYLGSGMAVMEMSHRSKEYEDINCETKQLLRRLLGIGDEYDILLLQGGASLQFTMVPMNLLEEGKTASYVLTGTWSEKALKEGRKIGTMHVAASSKDHHYKTIPHESDVVTHQTDSYLHITTNNTIFGTQWHSVPGGLNVPLVADMSSDILSRPIDIPSYDLIYAGAQKNLGPSGVTVVILKKDLLSRSRQDLPSMLSYAIHAKAGSLYHTPPTLSVYFLKLVLEWAEQLGGPTKLQKMNEQKAAILYETIDMSNGFYRGHAEKESRSIMNVTFTLANKEMEGEFIAKAEDEGFIGLAGHRSVGGCRASIYNSVPYEHVEKLARFMEKFRNKK